MNKSHRKEVLCMIKEYAKWLELYPDKYNDWIPIQVYWPIIKHKLGLGDRK